MKRIEAGGQVAYLSEQDYKTLVERFSASLKISDTDRRFFISKKPCICNLYPRCRGCPLNTWSIAGDARYLGCVSLLKLLSLTPKVLDLGNLGLGCGWVDFHEAEQERKAILEYLLSLPSVEDRVLEGVTCHYERGQEGQVYIIWGPDFPQDKPGRRMCTPEEVKEAQRLGLLLESHAEEVT